MNTAPQVTQHRTRQKARELALTRYYTGVPCIKGHVSERLVSNGTCIECLRISKKKHYVANVSKLSDYRKSWRLANIDRLAKRDQLYYLANKESLRKKQKDYSRINSEAAVKRAAEWSKNHPEAVRSKLAKRRASVCKRVPIWYGEFDELVWREAARLVKLRSLLNGFKWHADHIVPLQCKTASGFHIAENCQVIPAHLNIRKSNTLSLLTPSDWIFQS